MTSIEAYFAHVRQLMQHVPGAIAERYEEQLLTSTRGNLRLRLCFADQALLEISEAIVLSADGLQWLSYRYHYQDPLGALVLRYDNTPHHPEISSHPHHKHVGEQVVASARPALEDVLQEVQTFRGQISI
jgi:hypothetical protein